MNPLWGLISTTISKIWPDKSEQEVLQLKIELEKAAFQSNIDLAQIKTNTAEARSNNLFVAGWRPACGWICVIAFAWQFVVLPILLFISNAINHPIPVPVFETSAMITVLMGMLGLGGLRTFEKKEGLTK